MAHVMVQSPKPLPRERPRVVILGAGFGGLSAAKALARADADVVVLDRHNYHLFQPLLYQVATAGLSPNQIATPIRQILSRQRNATVLMDRVADVDLETSEVVTPGRRIGFDFLIVATGVRHAYFGNDQWESVAPGLKKIDEATDIRKRLLQHFAPVIGGMRETCLSPLIFANISSRRPRTGLTASPPSVAGGSRRQALARTGPTRTAPSRG